MLTNPNRSFFLGVAIIQRRKKKESSTVKLMLSQRSTSNMPQCRGMRSFLPRKPRERLIESPYNANSISFFLYSSICSGAHPALHLSARCSEKCHRGSIIPTSKRLTSFEGTLRATRRKKMVRSVQRYPRTDVPRI